MSDDPRSYELLPCPFIVLVDDREKSPYNWSGTMGGTAVRKDGDRHRRFYDVQTQIAHLPSGDYSILGHADRVAIERKSKEDLYCTLGQHRDRFERELRRLAAWPFAAVVVEAGWGEILYDPPPHSQLVPKTIFRSVLAWTQRYPSVHWYMLPDRRIAEQATFRILERWYRDNVMPKKKRKRVATP